MSQFLEHSITKWNDIINAGRCLTASVAVNIDLISRALGGDLITPSQNMSPCALFFGPSDSHSHQKFSVSCIMGYSRLNFSKGQNRKCTAEPSRDVKSVRNVKFANNYLNM